MNKLTIIPLNNRVVVEAIQEVKTTKGGIMLPDIVESNVKQSRVIRSGPGNWTSTGNRVSEQLKEGDVVIHSVAGLDINLDGKKYKLLSEDQILAVIREE